MILKWSWIKKHDRMARETLTEMVHEEAHLPDTKIAHDASVTRMKWHRPQTGSLEEQTRTSKRAPSGGCTVGIANCWRKKSTF